MKVVQRTATTGVWFYAIFILGWFISRVLFADSFWLLAMLNTFALWLFVPILITTLTVLWLPRRTLIVAWLVPVAIFIVLYGEQLVPKPIPASAARANELKVMTFNVNNGTQSVAPIVRLIETELPDIVFLQELNALHLESLSSELEAQYPYRAIDALDVDDSFVTLSRYPISDPGWMPIDNKPFPGQIMELEWEDQRVQLVNIHLVSTLPSHSFDNLPSRVEETYRLRENQARATIKFLRERQMTSIVAGDFNTTDATLAYAIIRQELMDAQRESGWGFGLTFPATPTLFDEVWAPFPLLRIDYIFHSLDVSAGNTYVAPWDGQSDHRAVITMLLLKK
ncbi:MAG: endonuclease/exonuclease/phosphatase family protein [Anaerolineae bacterium]|nr:endonuclease/exonuclease/phosphatase family protein [Anaerolineae bacterium]